MKTSEIVYTVDIRTTATHLRSGRTIITDGPIDNHGRGEAFSPTDLLATSLGCCMLSIMGIVATRHNLNIEGTKIEITKVMVADPRRVGEIVAEISMPHGNFSHQEKQLLENAARTCPVAKSLHPDLVQTISFSY